MDQILTFSCHERTTWKLQHNYKRIESKTMDKILLKLFACNLLKSFVTFYSYDDYFPHMFCFVFWNKGEKSS